MTTRRTKADLEQVAKVANGKLERMDSPRELYISYVMGSPRVVWFDRSTGNMDGDASKTGTKSAIYDWLSAFVEGLEAAERAARILKERQGPTIAELAEQARTLLAEHDGTIPELQRHKIEDMLTGNAWTCARLLDLVKGINPLKVGRYSSTLGTPNHRSLTYKVRKALGYSYP